MQYSKEEIYQSILLRAADEWNLEFADLQQDIGESFDPLVRFMAGGLASELEKVYQSLDDTEMRLQKRLARVLLPEHYHLPDPAHALATATPEREELLVDETYTFRYVPNEEDADAVDVDFSPVFPTRVLPLRVAVVATDHTIVRASRKAALMNAAQSGPARQTESILLGFTTKLPITNFDGCSLYFDLIQNRRQTGERASLLKSLEGATASYGDHKIAVRQGVARAEATLEDHLNGNERLRRSVSAFYERHLLSFRGREVNPPDPVYAGEYLRNWFGRRLNQEELEQEITKLPSTLDAPLYWLRIDLGTPVTISDIGSRLRVLFNVFPVTNRSLEGSYPEDHHYLHTNNIHWLHLQPARSFVSIRKVYIDAPPDKPVVKYKPFVDFRQDSAPSYSIRFGGVGRWDDFNAWKRLAYLLRLADKNHAQHELIDSLASNLSLDEVHALLARRFPESERGVSPTEDVYVILHKGSARFDARIMVEYWTSLGVAGNGIPSGARLVSATRTRINAFIKGGMSLVTPSKGGRAPLDPTHELNALKSVILSRGRIVTREDIKTYCKDFFRDKLTSIVIQDGVGPDERVEYGMTRILEVRLTPTPFSSVNDDWDGLAHELQVLLREQSSSHIPIHVFVEANLEPYYG